MANTLANIDDYKSMQGTFYMYVKTATFSNVEIAWNFILLVLMHGSQHCEFIAENTKNRQGNRHLNHWRRIDHFGALPSPLLPP